MFGVFLMNVERTQLPSSGSSWQLLFFPDKPFLMTSGGWLGCLMLLFKETSLFNSHHAFVRLPGCFLVSSAELHAETSFSFRKETLSIIRLM